MLGWLLIPIYRILDVVQANRVLLLDQKQTLTSIQATLTQILDNTTLPQAERVVFLGADSQEITEMIMNVGEKFDLPVVFRDKNGGVAPVDGLPEWSNDNESVLPMVVAADGMSAHFESTNGPGTVNISVTADADLGEGVRNITGILPVTVKPLEAEVVELIPGPVTPI